MLRILSLKELMTQALLNLYTNDGVKRFQPYLLGVFFGKMMIQ